MNATKNKQLVFIGAFILAGMWGFATARALPSSSPIQVMAQQADWDKSSLKFDGAFGCQVNGCELAQARVCNVGSGDMTTPHIYEVYFSATGNPKNGTVVATGTIPVLASGECTDLSYVPNQSGNYMFKFYQAAGHPGQGVGWSSQCTINQCVNPEPTATPEPTVEPTATPVPTTEPAATPNPTADPTSVPAATPDPTPTIVPASTPDPTADPGTPAPTAQPTANPGTNSNSNNDNSGVGGSSSSTASSSNSGSSSTPSSSQGQVLGASTLADTGRETEYITMALFMAGVVALLTSVYGYVQTQKRAKK